MATLRKELRLGTAPERVWDAVRDGGALHTPLVPGFVQDTRMEAIAAMKRALERAS